MRATDLDSLRGLFPKAIGVPVLIAGFMIIILFDKMEHVLQNAYTDISYTPSGTGWATGLL